MPNGAFAGYPAVALRGCPIGQRALPSRVHRRTLRPMPFGF